MKLSLDPDLYLRHLEQEGVSTACELYDRFNCDIKGVIREGIEYRLKPGNLSQEKQFHEAAYGAYLLTMEEQASGFEQAYSTDNRKELSALRFEGIEMAPKIAVKKLEASKKDADEFYTAMIHCMKGLVTYQEMLELGIAILDAGTIAERPPVFLMDTNSNVAVLEAETIAKYRVSRVAKCFNDVNIVQKCTMAGVEGDVRQQFRELEFLLSDLMSKSYSKKTEDVPPRTSTRDVIRNISELYSQTTEDLPSNKATDGLSNSSEEIQTIKEITAIPNAKEKVLDSSGQEVTFTNALANTKQDQERGSNTRRAAG